MDANGDIRHFKSEEYARRAGYTEPLTEQEAKQLELIEQEKRRQALHRLRRNGKAQVVRIEDMTEPELAELMLLLARQVEMTCKAKGVEMPLFTMLLFNDAAATQYISNCERQDMIRALRMCADRLDQQQDVPR